MTPPPAALKKVLTPVHLWGIAVGLVISGEYFGWNYGWAVAGPVGFLLATPLVTVLYVTFIFSFTELTTAIPQAGGPFAYSHRAFGPWGGFVAGYLPAVLARLNSRQAPHWALVAGGAVGCLALCTGTTD